MVITGGVSKPTYYLGTNENVDIGVKDTYMRGLESIITTKNTGEKPRKNRLRNLSYQLQILVQTRGLEP
jgi:hypothetical protein